MSTGTGAGKGKDVLRISAGREADQAASDARALTEANERVKALEENIAQLQKLEALKRAQAGGGNTYGNVSGEAPKSAAKAADANPAADGKNILEKAQEGAKGAIDDWVERQGDNKLAMAAGAISVAVVEVFMPTAWWELIPVGKAAKILKKGAEAVKKLKKGEAIAEKGKDLKHADNAVEAGADARKAQGAGKADDAGKAKKGGKDTQVKKKKKEPGPCDHLRQGSGTGPYRGGAHSKTSLPRNDGKDSPICLPRMLVPYSQTKDQRFKWILKTTEEHQAESPRVRWRPVGLSQAVMAA